MAEARKSTNPIELKKCITHEFRVSYPSVFEPKSFRGGPAKYGLTMCFDKSTDLGKAPNDTSGKPIGLSMKKARHNALVEKYGADQEKWPRGMRKSFRDGDVEKPGNEGYKNCLFATASSKTKPGIIDRHKDPITDPRDFYAGCYARAELIAFVYDEAGNRGVGWALQNLIKTRDGKPLSGKKEAAAAFADIEESDLPEDDESSYGEDESGDESSMGF